jgi:two-component system sensor histidine kinase DegS
MSDSTLSEDFAQLDVVSKCNNAYKFVNNLKEELDCHQNEVILQIKEYSNLIIQLEQELLILEKIQPNNYDLFSPYTNNNTEISKLKVEIISLRKKLDELFFEQKQLNQKKGSLDNVLNCIDHIEKDTHFSNKENNDKCRNLNKGMSLLEIQEKERQRIARDLHDSTVQNLTSLVHKTELCNRLIEIDTIRAKLELTSMSGMIKTVINDMRAIIYDLKPMSLDDLGLIITVERYVKQLKEVHDIELLIHHNNEIKGILPVINLTLFRIIQEACCNIIKHANATKIDISIFYTEEEITISVKDNGIGFDVEIQKNKVSDYLSGYGLSIMKERISLLTGSLNIQSEKGKGTIITVIVPITKCKGETNE